MAAEVPAYKAASDVPAGGCDNRKRALLLGVYTRTTDLEAVAPSVRPYLWHGQEFLLDSQLRIFRKENLRDKDFIWREIARRNRFVIFDVLLGINQNCSRFFCDSMIVGPFCQDFPCGVPQINFDSLVCWKFECNGTFGLIRQRQFDPDLSDLREFYRLWRYLQVECETAQSWIFVLRDSLGRERMEHAAQPAAPVRCRSRRRFLARGASHDREH